MAQDIDVIRRCKVMSKPSLITRIRNRYKDRKGQSTTEYILILAIVVMMAGKMKKLLSSKVGDSLQLIDTEMNKFKEE